MDPELMRALLLGMNTGGYNTGPVVTPVGAAVPPQAVPSLTSAMPPKPIEPYMTDPMMAGSPMSATPQASVPMPQPRPLGAVLDPNPTGFATNPWSQGGMLDPNASAGGPTAADASRLGQALKGVVAPPAPQAQKVSSPHAPTLAKIQGGNVADLLASLGIGPQQAFPGLKLPSTLGQALAGGR